MIRYQRCIRKIGRRFRVILHVDHRRQSKTEETEIESLLMFDPHIAKEALISMLGCYQEVADRPPPPARIIIAQMTSERVELYPPPGCSIPIVTLTIHVDDYVPEEEDIA